MTKAHMTDGPNTETILIITNSQDLHADLVEEKIKAKDAPVFRINLDEYPRDYETSMRFDGQDNQLKIHHIPSNVTLDLRTVKSVWLRKKGDYSFVSDEMTAQEKAFVEEEAEHVIFSLMYSLNQAYWLSHPASIRGAMWKGEQLGRAQRLGFAVPKTVLTDDPRVAEAFCRETQSQKIYKTIASSFLGADKVELDEIEHGGLGTTLLSEQDLQDLSHVRMAPCQFQEYIEKDYELRITVIGDKVFACQILSQLDERTKVDFRDYSVDIPYLSYDLSEELEEKCKSFVHSYGLEYGAIDIVRSIDGRYVFLENNPVGQFLFIEQLVPDLKMLDHVADCLISGGRYHG